MAQLLQALARPGVSARLPRIGIHDEIELAEHVIDDRELVGDEQQHVGRAERIGLFRAEGSRFDVAHGLVGEIAHQAAAEAQRGRQGRGALALEPRARVFERVALVLLQAHVGTARIAKEAPHARAACLDTLGAGKPDEGIAAEALAADHGFEEIAVRPARELDVHGERRVEVGARLGQHRDAGEALGCEPVELGLNHELLRCYKF